MKRNQKGFGVAELLLLLMLITLVAFAGWYVWDSSKKTNTALDNANRSSSATSNKTTPASTQKYVTIKEWGVRAPYDGKLSLSYVIDKENAYFTSKELLTISPDCTAQTGSGGAISRYAPGEKLDLGDQPTIEEFAQTNPAQVNKIGNYYYVFYHSQSGCGDESVASTQTQTNDDVKSLVPKLETN